MAFSAVPYLCTRTALSVANDAAFSALRRDLEADFLARLFEDAGPSASSSSSSSALDSSRTTGENCGAEEGGEEEEDEAEDEALLLIEGRGGRMVGGGGRLVRLAHSLEVNASCRHRMQEL